MHSPLTWGILFAHPVHGRIEGRQERRNMRGWKYQPQKSNDSQSSFRQSLFAQSTDILGEASGMELEPDSTAMSWERFEPVYPAWSCGADKVKNNISPGWDGCLGMRTHVSISMVETSGVLKVEGVAWPIVRRIRGKYPRSGLAGNVTYGNSTRERAK